MSIAARGETGALRNLFGQELSPEEEIIWRIYRDLKEVAANSALPPCVLANVRSALALVWQAVNDLNIEFEQLDAVEV